MFKKIVIASCLALMLLSTACDKQKITPEKACSYMGIAASCYNSAMPVVVSFSGEKQTAHGWPLRTATFRAYRNRAVTLRAPDFSRTLISVPFMRGRLTAISSPRMRMTNVISMKVKPRRLRIVYIPCVGSSEKIGSSIAITMNPTARPIARMITGSMKDVSVLIERSTSAS